MRVPVGMQRDRKSDFFPLLECDIGVFFGPSVLELPLREWGRGY